MFQAEIIKSASIRGSNVSVFERPIVRLSLKGRPAAIVVLISLSACSGGNEPISSSMDLSAARSLAVTSVDFKRIVAWGSAGAPAVAQCPAGYKIVAGGSSSSNGSFVGTGYASTTLDAWIVKPASNASAESFATCVAHDVAHTDFKWESGGPTSNVAAARCPSGYLLVTGYGVGSVKTSWFNSDTNSYWVTGGGTAYASCVRSDAGVVIKHAWNESQNPKDVYAGCGSGYTVIGGSMGDTQWPGPPVQQHPGVESSPGMHGYDGWWTFSNASNELTWAACVPQG